MNNRFVKIFSFLLAITAAFSCLTVLSYAETDIPDISEAEAVCLYNVNTDKNILSSNMQKKIFPGSAAKMMSGLIACEMLSSRLDERVTLTEEMLDGSQGYNVKLKVGMSVTLENLLYGVLCGGGNDAALALANVCGGGLEGFVGMMNEKASELGMKNTHFTNPTGLDDKNMYSTLADIMILAKKACENELYLEISSAMSYVYTPDGYAEEIKFFNRNALISTFHTLGYRNLYAYGLISGNTELGGYCVITYAEKKGTGYICAVMGADADEDTIYSYDIANDLIDYAFENYYYVQIAQSGQYICDIPTRFAMPETDKEQTSVRCVIKDDVYALTYSGISADTDLEYRYYLHNKELPAPVEAGEIVGGVDIIYNGETVGTAMLITADSASESKMLVFLESMSEFFTGRLFILCVIFFVLIFGGYYYFAILRFRHKQAKKINYRNFN